MTSIIPTAVLRAAVLSAFDRGRYSVTFATAPAGDDLAVVPSAIILNLEEQDDDLLGAETEMVDDRIATEGGVYVHVRRRSDAPVVASSRKDDSLGAILWNALHDDHGPAVPAQRDEASAGLRGGAMDRKYAAWGSDVSEAATSRVYEFALQDYWAASDEAVFEHLADIHLHHAPDLDAATEADWVHVYDRVTRERRTLKRPGVDRIVKGLADVAADLRGGHAGDPLEAALSKVVGHHAGRIAAPGQWRVWRDEAGRVRWEKFDA